METLKCLIVDDEKLMLTLLSEGLARCGYACTTVMSGVEAIEALANIPFDVMITDIQMDGMSGLELTRRVSELYAAMPVIVMTGFNAEYSYAEVIDTGAADFLIKPFSLKELEIRMAKVIRDVKLMAMLKKKGKDLEEISTLMNAGLQEEAQRKVEVLEKEIRQLRDENFVTQGRTEIFITSNNEG